MNNHWKLGLMAGVTVLSLAVTLTLSTARAQQEPQGPGFVQGGPAQPGQPGQQPGQPGQGFGGMRPGIGGGIGGGSAMVEDNQFLYILQGGRIFKINKADLRLTGQVDLPMQSFGGPGAGGFGQGQGQGQRGGQRGGGGQQQNQGGGGGGTPPPSGAK